MTITRDGELFTVRDERGLVLATRDSYGAALAYVAGVLGGFK